MWFPPDRKAAKRELLDHLEDRRLCYLEYGLTEQEAERRALMAMGDAGETGKLLNRVHSPVLGWLWLASGIITVLAVVWFGFLAANALDNGIREWNRGGAERYHCLRYQENGQMDYIPLAEVGLTRTVGDYTMTLDHGGWYRNREDDGFFLVLGWKVTARHPWQTMPLGLERMKLETSDGEIYAAYPVTNWEPEGPWIVSSVEMEETNLPVWTVHQTVDYSPGERGFLTDWFRFFLPDAGLEYTIQMEEDVWP